ncbi:MAG: hypothetical protein LUH02_11150 [Erysipelotrichaceae bacterium]|nr:hypothetical protein [Erysipelotrichaceae bacterium]
MDNEEIEYEIVHRPLAIFCYVVMGICVVLFILMFYYHLSYVSSLIISGDIDLVSDFYEIVYYFLADNDFIYLLGSFLFGIMGYCIDHYVVEEDE